MDDQKTYKMIDLRSDTITRPSLAMREAMMKAEVGDDVFGEDPTINELQKMSADIFGKEAGLFIPSGTMGNEIAINVHTQQGDEVIVDRLSHIVNFETGGPGFISGVNLVPLDGKNGILSAEQVEKAIRPEGLQFARTGLICLENTHNYAGGSVYPFETIKEISEIASFKEIPMHLDGARIFNAVVATGIKPDEYSLYFDSITFCISKGLGSPVGSVLLGSQEFIDQARIVRKILGGGMRQAGILAAAGIYGLENNVERLIVDHKNAKKLAEALNKTKTFDIHPDEVESNIVIFRISDTSISPSEASEKLGEKGILVFPFGERQLRAVTHLDVSDKDIEDVCSRLIRYF
ncbi:low-specificity L-threonine aldolase [candidate division KSB1 bacterium]